MWADHKLPWHPPEYDDDVVYAVRAVAEGIASPEQQKLFWRYLMYATKASEEFQSLSFRSDDAGGERGTTFAEGKRFVGMMFRKLFRPELTPRPKATAEQSALEKRKTRLRKQPAKKA